jgi:hypothetical protein
MRAAAGVEVDVSARAEWVVASQADGALGPLVGLLR